MRILPRRSSGLGRGLPGFSCGRGECQQPRVLPTEHSLLHWPLSHHCPGAKPLPGPTLPCSSDRFSLACSVCWHPFPHSHQHKHSITLRFQLSHHFLQEAFPDAPDQFTTPQGLPKQPPVGMARFLSFSPPDGKQCEGWDCAFATSIPPKPRTMPDTGLTRPHRGPGPPPPAPGVPQRSPLAGNFSRGSVSSMSPNIARQYSAILACWRGLREQKRGGFSSHLPLGHPPGPPIWVIGSTGCGGRQGHGQEGLGLEEIVRRAWVEAGIAGGGQHGRKMGTE